MVCRAVEKPPIKAHVSQLNLNGGNNEYGVGLDKAVND